VMASVAATGFVAAPSLGAGWTVLLGLGLGWIFPALFAYAADVARDAAMAGAISGFMLLGGYLLAAAGPIGLGLARDATGAFGVSFAVLALVGLCLVGTTLGFNRVRAAA
jgi:MFS transporter, CP family, cyanate transporter